MFCDRCGTNLPGDVRFCPNCGRQFAPAAPPPMAPRPAVNRVAGNLRTLAIIWMVYSALRILPGYFMRHWWGFPYVNGAPYFVEHIVQTIGTAFLITGVLGVIAGWGLLERQPWARTLALVLAFLNLFHFPLGTALGAYTFWVLMPAESNVEYQRLARS